MSTINYISYAYEKNKELDQKDEVNQESMWMFLFNPTSHDTEVEVTCYFEDPDIKPFKFKTFLYAQGKGGWNKYFHKIEGIKPNVRYGMKFASKEPILVEAVTASYWAGDGFRTRDMTCQRGMQLSKVWYYAYGYCAYPKEKEGLVEKEHVYVLNPNMNDAKIESTFYFGMENWGKIFYKGTYEESGLFQQKPEKKLIKHTHKFDVKGEHMKSLFLDDIMMALPENKDKTNCSWSARFVSTEPICVSYECAAYRVGDPQMKGRMLTTCQPWPLHLYDPELNV